MAEKTGLSASIQTKKGRMFAVIRYKENGKYKSAWRSLGLTEDASPAKIKKAYRETVGAFEKEYEQRQIELAKTPADIPVVIYLEQYLKRASSQLQVNTVRSYRQLLNVGISEYFGKKPEITIGNLSVTDIRDFYSALFDKKVTANTVIHYHAFLHKAFKVAFKDGLIDTNPFDRVDRPKKNVFVGDHLSEEELATLLKLVQSDPTYPAIMLAAGMGMRRSEALGVRWSRIDWDDHSVLLVTKVIEYNDDGKKCIRSIEQMKNKTSRRSLKIPDPVYEMLLLTQERQKLNKKEFKRSYNYEYEDYVCTDALGNLFRPSYITEHFSHLLEKCGLRHIRFHDLRHTFASILLNKEVPLINVSSFLGHSTIATTANIYGHLDKASKQATADIISGVLKNVTI